MRNWIIALLMGVCVSLFASTDTIAQLLMPGLTAVGGVTCSHSLNFSQACNSGYIAVGVI